MGSHHNNLLDDNKNPFTVSYFLVPGYSMMALSSAIEPLRSINRLLGRECYRWEISARCSGPVVASNGLELQAKYGLDDPPPVDLTIVVASLGLDEYGGAQLLKHLRWLQRHNRMMGAVSNGTFLLAQAGVVGKRHVTVHWESMDDLLLRYPDLNITSQLFCFDDGLLTAGGGSASMDMMLELLGRREGRIIASAVAEQFLHGAVRSSSELQRNAVQWRYQLTDGRLERAVQSMEANLAPPIRIARLASTVGLSERQMERLFLKAFGKTPSAFYMHLRLSHAHSRLIGTTDSLEEIADSMGFSSHGHFSRAFKIWCGTSPSEVRNRPTRTNAGFM